MSTWVSVSARTGELIEDLPLLEVDKVSQTLGRYETSTARLPINSDDAPPDWLRATKKGAACLILLDDNPYDPAHGIPSWGGMVTRRIRDETDRAQLDLISLEGYLDRRFTGDQTFAAVGQNTIVETLVNTYVKTGAKPGLPIRVAITPAGAGTLRDRTYLDVDDKTIYSILQDLMGVQGGPEWTIGWEWQTAPERLTPVLYVGSRMGSAVSAGFAPAATFDMPGCVSKFQLVEDYGAGRGATDVMATSSGEGGTRPQSAHQLATDADRPTFELRFSPSTSITDVATLNGHAMQALAGVSKGSTALALTAPVEDAPRLGVDWFIGDDVGYAVGGLDGDGHDTVPAFPGGLTGTARVAGWERTFGDVPEVTPILISATGAFDA